MTIDLKRSETLQQISAMKAGELDVGFMRKLDSYPRGIEAIPIGRQRFALALHRDHPLAKLKRVPASKLIVKNS